jgi:hypothetical protein
LAGRSEATEPLRAASMTDPSRSTKLSAAEAATADKLFRLLSIYPRDVTLHALDVAAFHFKLALKRRRKPRKPTLVSVSKQASKAAIEVRAYEVKPDGTVVVVTGKSESTEPEDPWRADLRKGIKQ